MTAMAPLTLSAFTLTTALGRGNAENYAALAGRRSGLTPCDGAFADIATQVGKVAGIETAPLVTRLADYECRNNRLAQIALQQDGFENAVNEARERYGPRRIGVFLGTSTSGIRETEAAYRERHPVTGALPDTMSYRYSHDVFSVGDFVRRYLQLGGPAFVVSTACSSSAKVFGCAQRLMALGLCDAAVVGGVDSLCATTLYGFHSLELVAPNACRPCDAEREGISIGEAGGFALLERAERADRDSGIALLGYGESSDAYHMSSPHPEGLGARLAMEKALASSDLDATDIDYINLHGTASKINDAVEDRAVSELFGARTPCSSTKGWTGHTLGAAGITEAVLASLCLQHQFIPGSMNTTTIDPTFRSLVMLGNKKARLERVMSNSFGFGGNNCSVILGRAA